GAFRRGRDLPFLAAGGGVPFGRAGARQHRRPGPRRAGRVSGTAPASERAPARGRVLVVEDEAYVRSSIEDLLRARGVDVGSAPGVEEALEALARSPIDVVLADLRMPGGGGLDLVVRARRRHPGVPVLILTGHGTVPSAVECMKAGAADYLLKPIDPEA